VAAATSCVLHPVFAPLLGVVNVAEGSITFDSSCLTRPRMDAAEEVLKRPPSEGGTTACSGASRTCTTAAKSCARRRAPPCDLELHLGGRVLEYVPGPGTAPLQLSAAETRMYVSLAERGSGKRRGLGWVLRGTEKTKRQMALNVYSADVAQHCCLAVTSRLCLFRRASVAARRMLNSLAQKWIGKAPPCT